MKKTNDQIYAEWRQSAEGKKVLKGLYEDQKEVEAKEQREEELLAAKLYEQQEK